ncbi:MAG TPA: hypothetical protein DD734_09935 [Firmicutes bacterium]|jgi:hypothetical protein|nr:hypothetical protein [Bacillota bacterium]HBR34944.1 hypothetical protein [Bacillota bacterium]
MNWLMLLMSTMILAMLIFALVMRYFIHRERMALIKQGIVPPALVNPILRRGSFGLLLAGLITALSGLGLLVGLYLGLGKGFWLIGGFVPIGVGVALIIGYLLSGGQESKQEVAVDDTTGADGEHSELTSVN